jgi:hypothetical protein
VLARDLFVLFHRKNPGIRGIRIETRLEARKSRREKGQGVFCTLAYAVHNKGATRGYYTEEKGTGRSKQSKAKKAGSNLPKKTCGVIQNPPLFFCGGIGDSAGATRRERSGSGENEKRGGCKKNSK